MRLTCMRIIAVFSKSWCPYCRAAKQLLTDQGAKFYTVELDEVGMSAFLRLAVSPSHSIPANDLTHSYPDDGSAIQDALQEMTHQRSVPSIFIDKKHIGGNSDLQARKAALPKLLKDAHAI